MRFVILSEVEGSKTQIFHPQNADFIHHRWISYFAAGKIYHNPKGYITHQRCIYSLRVRRFLGDTLCILCLRQSTRGAICTRLLVNKFTDSLRLIITFAARQIYHAIIGSLLFRPLADTLTVLLLAKHIVCPSGQHRCLAHHFSRSENITMPQAYFTATIGSLVRALAPSERELSAKLTEGVYAYRGRALFARRQGELHRKAEG